MKNLELYKSVKEKLGCEGFRSKSYFSRENLDAPFLAGTAGSIIYALFQAMPSIEEVMLIEHGFAELALLIKGNPNTQELEDGTIAVENVVPCSILVSGHVFNSDDFEKIKELEYG